MKKKLKLISICLISILCLTACSKVNENLEVKALKKSVIPISTVEAGNGFEDLMPLKDILKDKKIVAMGEATHGTSEFFKMKHRFFEFLVEDMDYRVFAMECDGGGGQVINDYILNDKGSLEEALEATKFAVWRTEEVEDMIKWMKEYNDEPSHKEKIRFYGFDMQGITDTLPRLSFYLDSIDKEVKTYVEEMIQPLYKDQMNIKNYSTQEMKNLKTQLNEVKVKLQVNKEKYIADNLKSSYEMALWNLDLVIQFIDYYYTSNGIESITISNSNLRDKYMADNVKWIQEHEKEQGNDTIMLWAHNLHVSHIDEEYIYMGKRLKDKYEDEYYSIGFEFSRGDFTSHGESSGIYEAFHIDNNDPNYLCYSFDKTKIPISFLDFKSASTNNVVSEFLSNRQYIHVFGDNYLGSEVSHSFMYSPRNLFDGLIYIKETTESKLVN